MICCEIIAGLSTIIQKLIIFQYLDAANHFTEYASVGFKSRPSCFLCVLFDCFLFSFPLIGPLSDEP